MNPTSALETERRFLVDPTLLPEEYDFQGQFMVQGYLVSEPKTTLRVRIIASPYLNAIQKKKVSDTPPAELLADADLFLAAVLTLKTEHSYATRNETETVIPIQTALTLLSTTTQILVKRRTAVLHDGMTWEIDTYAQGLAPLVVAEVEMPLSQLNEPLSLPEWCGEEVTGDSSLSNAALAVKASALSKSVSQ